MSGWLAEGVSARTIWGHPSPVVHLIVVERSELWCSGGRGRVASIHTTAATPGGKAPRECKPCRELAYEAAIDGTAGRGDLRRFMPDLYVCETVTAGPFTRRHLRVAGPAGLNTGGGADTLALCGRKVSWDLRVATRDDERDPEWTCRGCAEAVTDLQ